VGTIKTLALTCVTVLAATQGANAEPPVSVPFGGPASVPLPPWNDVGTRGLPAQGMGRPPSLPPGSSPNQAWTGAQTPRGRE
jgi:hypothetical protein